MVSMHLYFLFGVCVKLIQGYIDIRELHKQPFESESESFSEAF
jgi:hypothetical protein